VKHADRLAIETGRAVVEALRRTLAEYADGCEEVALWRGLEGAGVDRAVFDQSVALMVNAGWARRDGDRLVATAAIAPVPKRKVEIPADWEDETAERRGETIVIIGASQPRRPAR
jgi:hypothetical protein